MTLLGQVIELSSVNPYNVFLTATGQQQLAFCEEVLMQNINGLFNREISLFLPNQKCVSFSFLCVSRHKLAKLK